QANPAIDEQGIVGDVVRFGCLFGSRACDLIGFAFDERLERVTWIQVVRYGWGSGCRLQSIARRRFAATNQNANLGGQGTELVQGVCDWRAQFALDVIADHLVWSHQVETAVIEYGFKRAQPKVDIFLRQAVFYQRQAALPQGFRQDQDSVT